MSGRELSITINGELINNTSSYKYLGVNLDPSLNLSLHFDKMYKSAAGRVNLLRRIRPLIDTSSAKKIYKVMIQPIFTYCGALSLNISDSRKSLIKNIERRSALIICDKDLSILSVESLISRNLVIT